MLDLALLEQLTPQFVQAGHRLFQVHRFAETEACHAQRLLGWAELSEGAHVVDLGSGIGAMADYWSQARPDLSFSLVNISQHQLSYSSWHSYCGDFCAVPWDDASFDAATLCFAVGHADHRHALASAARLLRPHGVLFLYDMVRVSGDNTAMGSVSYTVLSRAEMEHHLEAAGFLLDWYMEPVDDGTYGRMVLGEEYDQIFHGTIPAIWRAIKR